MLKLMGKIRRAVIGDPLPSWEYKHQRLSKKIALAVFSSDSLSVVAYATEEIMLVLIAAGTLALNFVLPISLVIIFMLWILIMSYRQTIKAYPNGGGAYIVAKDNLGKTPGLIAGSALLLDYILTAAVSVAAGVAALTSAFPVLLPHKVIIGVSVLALITMMNLKGIKESGVIFAIPTYFFIISFFCLIVAGFFRFMTGQIVPVAHEIVVPTAGLSLFLILRAFSSGCSALTGIEAISDGVPAFKKPESKNARTTLLTLAILLTVLFLGTTFLSTQYKVIPTHDRTVTSILAEQVLGRNIFFYMVQAFTMLILFLAANTSYADFPRLCYFLARDKFLPTQFKTLGDRLVFSNGIMFLGFVASLLIIIFKGSVHLLIPLYAVGVFTSFTLSQAGMIKRSLSLRREGWKSALIINTLGALMSFLVLLIIASTKFLEGAWIIVILLIILVYGFNKINHHYTDVEKQLTLEKITPEKEHHIMVVPVSNLHKGVEKALRFAKTFGTEVIAVHVAMSDQESKEFYAKWEKLNPGIRIVKVESPYRSLKIPFFEFIDKLEKKDRNLDVTVVIPEFVPKKWWHHLLHNQTALMLKTIIHFRKRTSYISVQYHLK